MENTIRDILLRDVFGAEAFEALTEGERRAAERVLDWTVERSGDSGYVDMRTGDKDPVLVSEVIRYAICGISGKTWAEVASRSKSTEVAELRFIAIYLLHRITAVPKCRIAECLGFSKDHSTVSYALARAGDGLRYSRVFRRKYALYYTAVTGILDGRGADSLIKGIREGRITVITN